MPRACNRLCRVVAAIIATIVCFSFSYVQFVFSANEELGAAIQPQSGSATNDPSPINVYSS